MSFTLSFPHVFHAHYRASFTLRSFFHLSLSFSGRRQSTPSVSESETGFTCSSLLVPLVVPLSFTMERLSSSHALLLFFALSFTLLTHSFTLLRSLFHSSHTLFYSSSLSLSLFSHTLLLFFALSFTLLTHSSTLLCSLFHSSHTLFYSSSLSLSLFSHTLLLFFALSFTLLTHSFTLLRSHFHSSHSFSESTQSVYDSFH